MNTKNSHKASSIVLSNFSTPQLTAENFCPCHFDLGPRRVQLIAPIFTPEFKKKVIFNHKTALIEGKTCDLRKSASEHIPPPAACKGDKSALPSVPEGFESNWSTQ